MTTLTISICHRAPASKAGVYTDKRGTTWQLYSCDACLQPCRVTSEQGWGVVAKTSWPVKL